jgi:uncharacterized membrane protein YozB (DUF420 family)
MDKKTKTVGAKEGLGAGVITIGLLLIFLPSFSQKIADLDSIQSEAFGILSGAVMVFAIFIIIAGLAVILSKFDVDENS